MFGAISHVDTWAGCDGFGSALLQQYGIVAIIYGGSVVDDDFRDSKVADEWFRNKYNMRLQQKDLESTGKYRYDAKVGSGGTSGVIYSTMGGRVLAFKSDAVRARHKPGSSRSANSATQCKSKPDSGRSSAGNS
jgi:glyceraldehyde-3-phosphate dehydrogenase (ferredoxin)